MSTGSDFMDLLSLYSRRRNYNIETSAEELLMVAVKYDSINYCKIYLPKYQNNMDIHFMENIYNKAVTNNSMKVLGYMNVIKFSDVILAQDKIEYNRLHNYRRIFPNSCQFVQIDYVPYIITSLSDIDFISKYPRSSGNNVYEHEGRYYISTHYRKKVVGMTSKGYPINGHKATLNPICSALNFKEYAIKNNLVFSDN